MQVYINSVGVISPQQTYDGSFFEHPLVNVESCLLNCVEPNYKEYINAVALRRMSHVVKMGLAASSIAMQQNPEVRPDGVIVGTGLACLSDLEKFTRIIEDYGEQVLPPIPFINSAHNTVAGQIAIHNKLVCYNITYCHHFLSFEDALRDALLCFAEQKENILVGGLDERTSDNFSIYNIKGFWRKEPVYNLDLFKGSHQGTLNGEGAAFFMLSKNSSDATMAALMGVHTFFQPDSTIADVSKELSYFMTSKSLSVSDIDLFIVGRNGSSVYDALYRQFEEMLPSSSFVAYYKHLCGEYMTSTSFALWIAAKVAQTQTLPEVLIFRKGSCASFRRILIYNQALNKEHSFILVGNVSKA